MTGGQQLRRVSIVLEVEQRDEGHAERYQYCRPRAAAGHDAFEPLTAEPADYMATDNGSRVQDQHSTKAARALQLGLTPFLLPLREATG
ncbi:hypothetical protein [Streptomyces sp. R35]|uniref:Transposase n=1 Tax=Streptomyces sp. R35 TaxID=3238630 RepID=A0AB39SJ14_9ACTN